MLNEILQRLWIKTTCITLLLVGFSSTSQSATTFTFEQVGDDVEIRLDGTFTLQSIPVSSRSHTDMLGTGFLQIDPLGGVSYEGLSVNYGEYTNAVTQIATGLTPQNVLIAEHTDRYFSLFSNGGANFSNSLFVSSSPGIVTYGFNPIMDTFTITNTTLDSLGASGFNNTLAWTSNTGDTIHYNVIPEPSTVLFLWISGVAVLIIRRRRT